MVNSGEMRCGKITFTWDYDNTFKKVITPDENTFLSVPIVIRPVKCIGHNPLIVINGDELNGVYVVTPGNETITAWDSNTSKLFNCKFGHSCRKNYCAFVDCKAHRKQAQIVGELNKINGDGYPKELEIRLFSDYDCEFYDNAMTSRDHDINLITNMIKKHPMDSKLNVMQIAVHRQNIRFTPKPAPPPPKQKQNPKQQNTQSFKIDETGAFRRNIREALSKLRLLLEEVEVDEEQKPEGDQFDTDEPFDVVVRGIRETISILSGEKFRDEEIEKMRKDYEAFLDSQNKLFEEKVRAIVERNRDLAKSIVVQSTDSPQPEVTTSGTNTTLPLPPPPPVATTSRKWVDIVDNE